MQMHAASDGIEFITCGPVQYLCRLAERAGDAPLEAYRKRWLVSFFCVALLVTLLLRPKSYTEMVGKADGPWGMVFHALALLLEAAVVAWVVVTRSASETLVEVIAIVSTVMFLYCDLLFTAAVRAPIWPGVTIVVSLVMVLRARRRIAMGITALTLVYCAVIQADLSIRFGVLDIPGTLDYPERRAVCDCAKPPCARGWHLDSSTLVLCAAFVLSYVLLRNFSDKLMQENNTIEASVRMCEMIALCLADYDLEAAKHRLDDSRAALPPALHGSFESLIRNLRSYRPFLPDALFKLRDTEDALSDSINSILLFHRQSRGSKGGYGAQAPVLDVKHQLLKSPPGYEKAQHEGAMSSGGSAPRPSVTVACVGVAETALWDAHWEMMPQVVDAFMKITRIAMTECDGYEAKLVGDDVLVAFEGSVNACMFADTLHSDLLAANWPTELLDLSLCGRDGDGLWGGLSAKIGIASGMVLISLDDVSGRFVYKGPTVMRACYLQSICPAGATLVAEDIAESPAFKAAVQRHKFHVYHCARFKCSVMLPLELSGRLEKVSGALEATGTIHTSEIATQPSPRHVARGGSGMSASYHSPANMLQIRRMSFDSDGRSDSVFSNSGHVTPSPGIHWSPGAGSSRNSYPELPTPKCPSAPSLSPRAGVTHRANPLLSRAASMLSRVRCGTSACLAIHSAHDDVDAATDAFNQTLGLIAAHAARTGGSVMGLCASHLLVTWGVMSACPPQIECSLRFLGLLHRQPVVGDGTPLTRACEVRAGVACGSCFAGQVGSSRQRFVTAVGLAPSLAAILATAAARVGANALYASVDDVPSPAQIPALRALVRPVDRWRVMDLRTRPVIFEVDTTSLASHGPGDTVQLLLERSESSDYRHPAWSEAYWQAYHERDIAALRGMAAESRVVGRVVQMLTDRTHIFGGEDVVLV